MNYVKELKEKCRKNIKRKIWKWLKICLNFLMSNSYRQNIIGVRKIENMYKSKKK
jgi:hypothetical protein